MRLCSAFTRGILTDRQPIFLRAAHSPWPQVDQGILTGIRLLLTGYITAVVGVALKYKLEDDDLDNKWSIIFRFSTVSFFLLWAWHILLTVSNTIRYAATWYAQPGTRLTLDKAVDGDAFLFPVRD